MKGKVAPPEKKGPPAPSPAKSGKPSVPSERIPLGEDKKTEYTKNPPDSPFSKGEDKGDYTEKGVDIYRETTMLMENLWFKLEKGKSFEMGLVKNLSAKLVNVFLESPGLIAEVNKPSPIEDYFSYHSVNVCLLSVALGIKFGYNRERLFDLAQAALLHDVGMAKIPKNIFMKPEKLTETEKKKIQEHPLHSRSILENMTGFTHDILQGVHQSHERENGQGYPSGYKNGEIHEFAKIIGLADTYEALTHDRVYRKAICPYNAIREIIRKDGQFFHHSLLKILIETVTFYPLGCYVELSTGEIGIVDKVYSEFPMRPVVKIILDKDKTKISTDKEVDLSVQPFISVKKIFKKETLDKFLEL